MSAADKDGQALAINNARALLATLVAGDVLDVYVALEGTEIFIARQGGRSNPMRVTKVESIPKHSTSSSLTEINAPHVSTLVEILAVGKPVVTGDWVATVRVLEDEHQITAPSDGSVIETFGVKGSLLQFGDLILTIAGTEHE